ncbi:MAG TPA: ParB/RepB/Spo0J family partition protein [Candidatus Limiplasma sp.]|nr:ParB/RepB/Spo0J family partition protein [Candidatus Limiplasma sp.]HPS81830.1 ParB/RepB/Spo0J family partition protein [Candidatus Limiplasma sp.]
MKKTGLGRGLEALLPQSDDFLETTVRDIPIADIDPNLSQPRKDFDKDSLEQLAESIRQAGILQPILVVENGTRYRIIAGERRYRAARLVGLETVPCIARSLTEEQQMEAALIENLQREDLNPIEEAQAIRNLMQQCGYTQEEVAKRLGKSRPAVANLLRLLTLPEGVIHMVVAGELSAGHARVLAGITPESRQLELAHQCVLHDYNVRKLEEIAQKLPTREHTAPSPARTLNTELLTLQDTMRETLGVKTALTGNERKGKITLTYSSAQELEHIYDVFGRLANEGLR